MDIIILLVAIILIIVAFFIGRKFASKPIDDKNEEIKKQCEQLRQHETELEKRINELNFTIKHKEAEIKAATDKQELIQAQYKDKMRVIENTKQLAEEAETERRKVLEATYEKDRIELENQRHKLLEEIEQTIQELNSLQNTKIATIEAARKEQEIQENKEFYTLQIPKEEKRDVEILEDTKLRISKPRAIAMVIWTAYYQQLAKNKFPKILGKQDVCGIYKITNLQTEECYIGQAKDVRKRWYEHVKAGLDIDTPTGNKLYQAMQKYGIENFSFELLEECQPRELDKKEAYFIELYNAVTFGYNSMKGKQNG